MVAAIETASQTTARVTIGKPEPYLLEAAARLVGADASEAVMIGDALTDVAAGRAVGARTVLMLTGVTTRETADALPPDERPTRIAADGEELAARPRRARRGEMRPLRRLPLLVAALVAVVGGCAVDPKDNVEARLRAAQSRWAAAALEDYRFTLAVYCLCPFKEPVDVTVRDGQVTSVTAHGVDAPADDVSWYPLTVDLALRSVEEHLDADEITVK